MKKIIIFYFLMVQLVYGVTLQLPAEKEIIYEQGLIKEVHFSVGNNQGTPIKTHVSLKVPPDITHIITPFEKHEKLAAQSGAEYNVEIKFPNEPLTPGVYTVSFEVGESSESGGMGGVTGASGGFNIISLAQDALPHLTFEGGRRTAVGEKMKYRFAVRNIGLKPLRSNAKVTLLKRGEQVRTETTPLPSIETLEEATRSGEFNTEGLPSGDYVLELNINNVVSQQRVILGSPRVRYLGAFENLEAGKNNSVQVLLALDDWDEPLKTRVNLQSYGLFDVAEDIMLYPGANNLTFNIIVSEARTGVYRTSHVISAEGVFLRAGGRVNVEGTTFTAGKVEFTADKERVEGKDYDGIAKTFLIALIFLVFVAGSFMLGRKVGK